MSVPAIRSTRMLDIFCIRERVGWRVYVAPEWIPESLRDLLDPFGEIAPVELDFSELLRLMEQRHAHCTLRVTLAPGIQVTASGDSSEVLAQWLLSMTGTFIGRAKAAK